MNSPRRSTTLIVPALNEEAVIGTMLSRIPAGLFHLVIVADNGSTDRTADVARERGALVVRTSERGYGAACLRAMEAIPPDCFAVVFMQADASEKAEEAASLLAPLLDGRADLVIGSRTMGTAEPGSLLLHQEFGNWLATTLIRWIHGFRYTDLGPFRAIRADALRQLGMKDRNYGWTVEMQVRALRQGLRVMEVPVSYGKRHAGTNKVSGNLKASLAAGWKILYTVAAASLEKPHRVGE
ncbi:MAG: glycosyltransferase family 2 protein [Bryobacteraceae bacterium]|nr:glycosyltransferase family 2 protein [Bryobacteraceae bacterium]